MHRERMSTVDTAWLRMDSSRNLMVIVGVLVFRTPVARGRIEALVEERLLRFRRFRQRIEVDVAGHWWVDDEHFRLSRHVKSVRLPACDARALQRLAADLATRRFDSGHPLWQWHLVGDARGVHAMVARMHHCIADGVALVRVLLSLADGATQRPRPRDAADAARSARSEPQAAEPALDGNPWDAYLQPITQGAVAAIGLTGDVVADALDVLAQPGRLVDHAQAATRIVRDALAIARMSDDSHTGLKGTPGGHKALAWNEPLPLDEVKPVCRALGASVNDVLLACVAGALRRHLLARGEQVAPDCEFRALVPVNLRPPADEIDLGNRFGLVPLLLPIGIANPIERVREVHRRMQALKEGYQPILAYLLLAVAGAFPKPLQDLVLEYLACKASAVMTNVPGPREALRMAGSEVSRIMVWVPQSSDIGLGVAIFSYVDGVQFGVIADTRLCADPQSIIDGFGAEFERLVLALAMLPNGILVDGDLGPVELEHMLLEAA